VHFGLDKARGGFRNRHRDKLLVKQKARGRSRILKIGHSFRARKNRRRSRMFHMGGFKREHRKQWWLQDI
jgi:hypothetical protein